MNVNMNCPGRCMTACLVMAALSGATAAAFASEADADLPADGLLISVVDAESGKPIPEFQVLAGVKSGSVSEEFEKRTGQEIVSWQPHTIRPGQDGALVWPLAKAYDLMALRIEADGFQPATSPWIKKSEGARKIVIRLAQDSKIRGRVRQPDGKPAAKATIAVALPQKDAVLEGGRLRGAGRPLPEALSDRWRLPEVFEADAVGEFRVRTETDPGAAVLILHESGVAELPFAKFAGTRDITLEAWGRIEGNVQWHDKPGADEPIGLTIHRDAYGYPGTVSQYENAKTDAAGRFVFDKALPGPAQVSRWIPVEKAGGGEGSSWTFPGLMNHVTVRSGDPTRIVIGGQGRKVTGRMVGRDAWDDVMFHFHPTAPRMGSFGGENGWSALGKFRASPCGPLFFRDKLRPNADGTFEIPHMLPGEYQLFVSEVGAQGYVAARTIKIDAETPDEPPAPLDLGKLELRAK